MRVPTCKKCLTQHWNVVPCVEAAEKTRVSSNLMQPVFRPRANDWGNRLNTVVEIAPGVIGLRRGPLHSVRAA